MMELATTRDDVVYITRECKVRGRGIYTGKIHAADDRTLTSLTVSNYVHVHDQFKVGASQIISQRKKGFIAMTMRSEMFRNSFGGTPRERKNIQRNKIYLLNRH